ncbi:MAG TPA: hypothetical protein VFV87_20020 [Pirellulaceae bacterium]|nr:hypothetical protein [Pirellulaceae bacterium]
MPSRLSSTLLVLLLVTLNVRWDEELARRRRIRFPAGVERAMLREGRLPRLYELDRQPSSGRIVPDANFPQRLIRPPSGDCQP